MKSYGLPARAPLAITHPSAPSVGIGGTNVPPRGTTGIATAKLQIQLPEVDLENLPEWAEKAVELILLNGLQRADVKTKCTLIKNLCKKKFLLRQVRTAIRKSSNWGDFLKRLEDMYPGYKTDFSVRTEIDELTSLPEFQSAARISEFVSQLEELMKPMNPTSYGPTELHL